MRALRCAPTVVSGSSCSTNGSSTTRLAPIPLHRISGTPVPHLIVNAGLPAEQPLAPETVDVGAKRIDGHRRIALPPCSPFNLVRGVAAQSGGMGTALFTAHHQHRACRMVEDRVAVRPDQTGQFVGVDTTGAEAVNLNEAPSSGIY